MGLMSTLYSINEKQEIETIFFECTSNIINKMSGFELTKINKTNTQIDIICGMVLSGLKNCLLLIKTDTRSAKQIVSYMTGIDDEELSNADIVDGIKELVNMTAGNAKVNLSPSYMFELTSPFGFQGYNINTYIDTYIEKFEYNLSDSNVYINVSLHFMNI